MFTVIKDVLTPKEQREILETPVTYMRSCCSLQTLLHGDPAARGFIEHVSQRSKGRLDFTLTSRWYEAAMQLASFRKLHALAQDIRKQTDIKKIQIVWHVMTVEPSAETQDWHKDAPGKRFYKTIIIPLTYEPKDSGTEFLQSKRPLRIVCANPYGGAVVFDGRTVHRGSCHKCSHTRVFLYAAVFSGSDPNT